ncbi:hypothetical protein swp_0327 [Shewanella piezotolerans WP3]|uniref:Uncharacterized protein n=1 Tax=Shewanella piezotolerans (strain WP3 / JCM 13877) TaxID=225849 RepID=B8CHN6_SHEPW|nr:hypothetical protein swp_0327 [Shewanella piezotolerans WP3]
MVLELTRQLQIQKIQQNTLLDFCLPVALALGCYLFSTRLEAVVY